MTSKERAANSGKGKSRRQIAQEAVDKLRMKLIAAESRLEEAIKHEEGNADKIAEKAAKKRTSAINALVRTGSFTEEQAAAIVDGPAAGAAKTEKPAPAPKAKK